jgi:hypothetical protein
MPAFLPCQALILMEMTQAPAQLPFLMLTLVLSKEVGDHFNYSVFDHQMMLKGLQFVGIDEEKARKSRMVVSVWGCTLRVLDRGGPVLWLCRSGWCPCSHG